MSINLHHLQEEIIDQYNVDDNNRPWIIGFSGGKDSTMLLQVVWNAVKTIPVDIRRRQIYVVCNNTLVENPKIIDYTEEVLEKIQKASAEQSMLMTVVRTTPRLEDTFWVNVIGKGYPSPNNVFRWCTERLKINPTTKFILEKINEQGEVIILLGTRKDESTNRAKSMNKYEVEGQRLRKHVLPNAYVFAPLKDVLTDEVWQYLSMVASPWGANNNDLITLYRNASGGDCPLVIDTTTPSCGNSRFGCWVCTVVSRDKSMEALVENGESWMSPLMQLRDELAKSRDNEECREKRRRDGSEKEGVLGPYKPEYRAHFLKLLLEAQRQIQDEQPDINLINYQELVAIQVTWYRDTIFNYKVADIYNSIYNSSIVIGDIDSKLATEHKILKEVCSENPKDFTLLSELLALQKTRPILMNKRGLQNDLENRLEKFIKK